jgi:hypothetical protein
MLCPATIVDVDQTGPSRLRAARFEFSKPCTRIAALSSAIQGRTSLLPVRNNPAHGKALQMAALWPRD